MKCIWIVLAVFILDTAHGKDEPCSKYHNVSEADLQKSFSNSKCFPETPIPQWYRFTSNAAGTMFTDCKSAATACGGSGQVWINDSLPQYTSGTINVVICINMNACCSQKNKIAVRNCNSFYVFKLTRLPNCDVQYCFNKADKPLVTVKTTHTASTYHTMTTEGKSTTSPAIFTSKGAITTRQSTFSKLSSVSTISISDKTGATSIPTTTLNSSTLFTLLTATYTTVTVSIPPTHSSSSVSSILISTIQASPKVTSDTQVSSTGTRIILHYLSTGYLDKTSSTIMSTKTGVKTKAKVTDEITMVIAVCGSIGALLLIAVIFVILFRVYRSNLQQVIPIEQQTMPECRDTARNRKFDLGQLKSRTNISL